MGSTKQTACQLRLYAALVICASAKDAQRAGLSDAGRHGSSKSDLGGHANTADDTTSRSSSQSASRDCGKSSTRSNDKSRAGPAFVETFIPPVTGARHSILLAPPVPKIAGRQPLLFGRSAAACSRTAKVLPPARPALNSGIGVLAYAARRWECAAGSVPAVRATLARMRRGGLAAENHRAFHVQL